MRYIAAFAVLILGMPGWAFADDASELRNWHQFRGPLATGVAPEAKPPIEWGDDKNIKWKVEIPGNGSSTPIVWDDKIFILTAIKTDRVEDNLPEIEEPATRGGNPFQIQRPTNYYKFVVMCFDRESGQLLWQDTVAEEVPNEAHHMDHGYASASPTTDGEFLYVSFGSRGIYCYDMDGNQQWSRDLGEMQILRFFGESTSPVLHDNSLIVQWDHEGESFVVSLDAATGEINWQVPRSGGTSWSTPLIVENGGKTQVIVSGRDQLHSYDLETGEVIWDFDRGAAAAVPVPIADDNLVYCMTGYPPDSRTLNAIPLSSRGTLTADQMIWTMDRGTPYVPSPLLYGDRLYFNSFNSSVLSSYVAATGETLIDNKRLPGIRNIYSSPVGADGRIYFTSRNGKTVVIKDGPELEVLATNELDDSIDASLTLVGDEIIVRGKKYLYCISEE